MKLLYLSTLSFVFLSSCALVLSKGDVQSKAEITNSVIEKRFVPAPVLAGSFTFPLVSAESAFAMDLNSGVTLYEKDPDKRLLPASTTKIVTALVALDYYPLDQVIKAENINVEGQKMKLVSGEEMRVDDLLYGLLTYSANDAAEALASAYPGGRQAFIDAMNVKAKEMHMDNSHFTNPVGLDGDEHYSTAKDLVRVASVAMQNPEFAKIVATKEKIIKSTDGKIAHRLVNVNELLGTVEGVLGVKTGWTENAKENLVTYIQRGDKRVMIAVLGSQDRFGETKELINWIYSNYQWQDVIYSGIPVQPILRNIQ